MKRFLLTAALAVFTSSGAHADCEAEFKSMLEAMPKAGPYHYEIASADGSNKNEFKKVVEADYLFGIANHVKMQNQEMLITADGAWQMADGKWQQVPEAQARPMQAGLKNPWYVHPEKIRAIVCLGQQDFEGTSYVTYGFDIDAFMGANTPQHVVVMKGASNLPAIIKAEKISNGDRLIGRLRFDPSIKIETPKP